jgi:hypothetical protein
MRMAIAMRGSLALRADDLDCDALRDTFGQIDIVDVTTQRGRSELLPLRRVPGERKIHWRLRMEQSAYRRCI